MVALAVVIVLLVIGSLIFHFASPWYFTTLASNWSTIDFTVDVTFWVCGIVFVAVNLFTAYCVWRFRARPGNKAHYEPESTKLEIALTAVTTIGVAAMLTPGLFVWAEFVQVPDDAATVEAVGKQWHWSFRLPGARRRARRERCAPHERRQPAWRRSRPMPTGQDDIVIASPILHLPVDQPTRVLLRSTDVLHNFTVPQFRVKMDLVPGLVTYQWFTPTLPGTYEILCEELCGTGHFAMRGKVVVDEAAAYQTWLANQPTFAQTQARPVGNATAGQANFADLLGVPRPARRGQSAAERAEARGPRRVVRAPSATALPDAACAARRMGDQFGPQMAPMSQFVADPATRENVLAYIETLPNNAAPVTVTGGDAERGAALYSTCATCHGAEGQGRWGTNAPRLAGMSDWYLERQLQYFKAAHTRRPSRRYLRRPDESRRRRAQD